jgi:hypothetical protein
MALITEPDLILLDLFWVLADVKPEVKAAADERLRMFQNELNELRAAIYQAYDHQGIDNLKMLRQNEALTTTPIMIYSKTGQLLLDPRGLRDVIEEGAEWLPKSQENVTPDIECLWIERFIESKYRTFESFKKLTDQNETLLGETQRLSGEIERLSAENKIVPKDIVAPKADRKSIVIILLLMVIAALIYPYTVMIGAELWQKLLAIGGEIASILSGVVALVSIFLAKMGRRNG